MSGGFMGMDIEAVRSLAGHLNAKAEEIDSLAAALTSELHGVQWIGSDGDAFRNEWELTYRSQLHAVSSALREASTTANANAAQQARASSS